MKIKQILKIAEIIKNNSNGYSINGMGAIPTVGYMVALEGYERKIPINTNSDETIYHIQRFVIDHWDLVAFSRDLYFGVWLHNGFIYLDISENVPCKIEAEPLAKERNQIAFYSVREKYSITLQQYFIH